MNIKAKKAIEDLKQNNNWSLWKEIYEQNKHRMDEIAIEYRGNKITYREMFSKVDQYAMSLYAKGYRKGKELLACVSNSPEFIYLLLASSKLGLVFNTIGEWFDKDYLEEIIDKNQIGTVFVSNDNYSELRDILNKKAQEVVAISLEDSLPLSDGRRKNPFEEIDKKYKDFHDHTNYKSLSTVPVSKQEEFLKFGEDWARRVINITEKENPYEFRAFTYDDTVTLDTPFTVTYTSGTTDPGKPKATLHPVKSLSLLARFKKSDVSGMPTMKNVRVMAHIPTYVFAGISTSITDPLYLGCTVIPEPIYDKNHFPYAIILNRPNMSAGSVGFWRELCMKLEFNKTFKRITCPYLYIAVVTGEAMGPGEEKFFNATARNHKFGIAKLPFPLAPITFSIGGGTNEFTGIFVTLFKALQAKRPDLMLKRKKVGQTPLNLAEVEILDEEGNPVEIGEYGEIVANTECNMIGYYYRPELDESTKRKDITGKKWTKMGAYGTKLDNLPHLEIKGRMSDTVKLSNNEKYPLFKIDDLVAKDTKNILSSSVIKVENGEDINIIIHVEPQPKKRPIKNRTELIKSIVGRLDGNIPEELKDSIYIRYRSTEESFPIAPSGKRNTGALIDEDINELTIPYREIEREIQNDGKTMVIAIQAKRYL